MFANHSAEWFVNTVWNSVPLCQSLALNFAMIAVMSSCCS
jgi:hypothetical protein